MKLYLGTKLIQAEPCAAWKQCGEWCIGADGYKVIYEDGYESWSPKRVFEDVYRRVDNMSFGLAIEALKNGCKVSRSGWNGKGMWLILVAGTKHQVLREGTPYYKALKTSPIDDGDIACEILPHIDMWTTNSEGHRAMLPGWLASQTDMLADDWQIVF